jgi:hypothetical protein
LRVFAFAPGGVRPAAEDASLAAFFGGRRIGTAHQVGHKGVMLSALRSASRAT